MSLTFGSRGGRACPGKHRWEQKGQEGGCTQQALAGHPFSRAWLVTRDAKVNKTGPALKELGDGRIGAGGQLPQGLMPDAGKDWRQKKRTTGDEMAGWHHQLKRHEPEQTPGDRERQGSPKCCNPGGYKESVTTQPLNSNGRLGRRRGNQGGLLRGSDTCKNYQRMEKN